MKPFTELDLLNIMEENLNLKRIYEDKPNSGQIKLQPVTAFILPPRIQLDCILSMIEEGDIMGIQRYSIENKRLNDSFVRFGKRFINFPSVINYALLWS